MGAVADMVKQERVKRGWSIRRLAREVECPPSVIAGIEKGTTQRTLYLAEIAAALDLRIEYVDGAIELFDASQGVSASGFGDVLPVLSARELGRIMRDNGPDLASVDMASVETRRSMHEDASGFWLRYDAAGSASGGPMAPTLRAGEDVLVNVMLAAESSDIVLALLAGDRVPLLRRLSVEAGEAVLRPDNPEWEPGVLRVELVDDYQALHPVSVDAEVVRCKIVGVASDAARSLM